MKMKNVMLLQMEGRSLRGGHIPGTGRYRLLATPNAKGQFEWTHFIERDNGYRDHFMRGLVQNRQELEDLIALINRTLTAVFGEGAMMQETAGPLVMFPGVHGKERLS